MRIRPARSTHPRRLRRIMTALTAAVGIGAGMLAASTEASAFPVGGYCYNDWYDVSSVDGITQTPLITPRTFVNDSGSTVTWHESYTNTTTYTSNYSTTTTYSGGIDWGIIHAGVSYATTVSTTYSITVTTASSFDAPVPPHTTANAVYGTYQLQTSGTYNQTRYACEDDSFPKTTTSGSLTAYSLTSVGWHYWDSSGSSGDL